MQEVMSKFPGYGISAIEKLFVNRLKIGCRHLVYNGEQEQFVVGKLPESGCEREKNPRIKFILIREIPYHPTIGGIFLFLCVLSYASENFFNEFVPFQFVENVLLYLSARFFVLLNGLGCFDKCNPESIFLKNRKTPAAYNRECFFNSSAQNRRANGDGLLNFRLNRTNTSNNIKPSSNYCSKVFS